MSEEGKGTDEAIKVFVSEKEGNTPDLSGGGIMNPVGSNEEEGNLNSPIPAPHPITHSSSTPLFLAQVDNAELDPRSMVQQKRSNGMK